MTLTLLPVVEHPAATAMASRRTLVATAAGITVARLLLPANVRTDGEARQRPIVHGPARAELEALAAIDPATERMLAWWDEATKPQRRAFIGMLARVEAGMPVPRAAALAYHEGLA